MRSKYYKTAKNLVLLYLNNYCCIVISCFFMTYSLILLHHLLHIHGTLQGMKQRRIVNGIIQSVHAKEDAVNQMKFQDPDIRHCVLWMTGEESFIDIG